MNKSRYIIGIGAQKAGTWWLENYFSKHPETLMSPLKEVHFFDNVYAPELCEIDRIKPFINITHKLCLNDILKNSDRFEQFNRLIDGIKIGNNIQNYRNHFSYYAKQESVFCDITPTYALLDYAGFEAMKDLADDVRLIFLMDNPIDRFWSAICMRTKQNPKFLIVINKCLAKPSLFDKFINSSRVAFVSPTNYDETLSTVYSVFPKERVFVQFYEHLFKTDTISQLCSFCGIEFISTSIEQPVLAESDLSLTTTLRQHIYNKFRPIYQWAEIEFGSQLPQSWLKDIADFQ